MKLLLALLMVGQFVEVYTPHEPLDVEPGSIVGTASSRLWVSYRAQSGESDVFAPVVSSFAYSPDGFNEFGIYLPWLAVAADTAGHVYFGNLGLHYKRHILGSLKWGYLAARLDATFPTSRDTLGIRESLGGKRSSYGLGLSYGYELPLLGEYHDLFARLPLVGTIDVHDVLLKRDHERKTWEFSSVFSWGAALEILPLDYAFVGFAVHGDEDVSLAPYVGFRWYWFDLGAAYRIGNQNRLDLHLKIYL